MEHKYHVTNNKQIDNDIKEAIKRYREANENENTATHNQRDRAKAVRQKFTASQAYLKKQDKPQTTQLYI